MPAVEKGRKLENGQMDEPQDQLGFDLGEEPRATTYTPNLQHIREDMDSILQEARSAVDASPWDERTFRYKKIVFLQMAKWLPEEEAAQLCFTFMHELERIEQLLAA